MNLRLLHVCLFTNLLKIMTVMIKQYNLVMFVNTFVAINAKGFPCS